MVKPGVDKKESPLGPPCPYPSSQVRVVNRPLRTRMRGGVGTGG